MVSLENFRRLAVVSLISLALSSFPTASAEPTNILTKAKQRWIQGDTVGVIALLESWSKGTSLMSDRENDAARILLAKAYEERGDWNLAAELYNSVKDNNMPLSKFARFQEPWANFKGGSFDKAKSNCESIVSKYSGSDRATDVQESDDCLITLAMSHGQMGNLDSSQTYFNRYLKRHPESSYREVFTLRQALYTYRVDKKTGYDLLYELYFNHAYPTTDTQIIAELGERIPITNLDERTKRTLSLIKGNRLEEAWQLVLEINDKEQKSDSEQKWLDNNIRNFSWKTRNFDVYAEVLKKLYKSSPSGDNAWRIYRAYIKGGMWQEAVEWGNNSVRRYRTKGRWSGIKDSLARAHMFAGDYKQASRLWDAMNSGTADFYVAFCLYMAGEYKQAEKLFTKLQHSSSGWGAASAYWLGRTQQKMGNDPLLAYATAEKKDKTGWYDLLLSAPSDDVEKRVGRWTRGERAIPPNISTISWKTQSSVKQYQPIQKQRSIQWNNFSKTDSTITIQNTEETALVPTVHKGDFPNGYNNSLYGTSDELENNFHRFADKYNKTFSNLKEIEDLVKAGLYQASARAMGNLYKHWEKGRKGELSSNQNSLMRSVNPSKDDWRLYFIHTQCHHYVLRYTYSSEKYQDDQESIKQARQLNYPIVQPEDIWDHAQKYDIDPYLILGLLRQESAYKDFARSWVGAIGYIQVMPATGAKVAYMLNKQSYSPKDLENPNINLQFGMFYFSKLMERFDNSFPFAVGSYNGGPHNMSRWYRNKMGVLDMAEFVEHIEYKETRGYVKKVTGYYNKYLQRYSDNSIVQIPLTPSFDDPKVIDF
jgi:TolA-binding protein